MSRQNTFVETIFEVATDAVNKGIAHLYTEDNKLSGNKMHLKGREVVNFGSCSYLGLEFDKRMIAASQEAVQNYGTTFAESRAYVSIRQYEELENLFGEIFNHPSLVAQTTTLGHIAAIPVLVNDNDAIILDHQVHYSVQIAVNMVKSRGIHVEMLRHNRMDMLEDRIKVLRQKHSRIWYLADGIYSMYGDASPVNNVFELMNKYHELYYYADDAHGISCFGKNGSGYVLSQKPMHDRMLMAASLAKGFATGGAVLVFPNQELAGKVRKCGSSFITSGPMQPSQLGAAIASAKIHLSNEIYSMQEDLHENIKFANLMVKKYELPLVAETNSPVFFIGVSLPKLGYNMVKRMLNEGSYLNLGIFPAVPIKNTGIRFTITRLHTFKQIESMIAAMAHHLPIAMAEEGVSLQQIYKAFKMELPEEKEMGKSFISLINQVNLKVEHHNSITDVNKEEWDNLLGERGTFDWNGLKFLEDSFSGNELPEDNWTFDYLIIKDNGKPVLATFLTTAICKDDMLSPAAISAQVEEKRMAGDKYYLTSRVLFAGSLLTEGNHLYLDRTSPLWKDAMNILFEKISELQEKYNASGVTIRDLEANDEEMDAFLVDNGYFKISMPENHTIDNLTWQTKEEFIQRQSSRSRRHLREDVVRNENKYEIEIFNQTNYYIGNSIKLQSEIRHWYRLYLNVKQNSLALNTFTLPFKFFNKMVKNDNWDILILKLKPEFDTREERKAVAIIFGYISKNTYNPMIVGLDYNYQQDFMCYRQSIYQVILRARQLNLKKINLGFGATVEKRKYGANIFTPVAYMQVKDNYNMEVLGTMSVMAIS